MKCEHCQTEEAEVHIRQTSAGQTREFHLCRGCARKLAAEGVIPDFSFGGPTPSLLGSLWKISLPRDQEEPDEPDLLCPSCAMDLGEFRKTGVLGCPHCYVVFREAVEPLLRKIQGSTVHRGLRPEVVPVPLEERSAPEEDELALLRRRLVEAVADERYEEAAGLRDRIRSLQGESRGPS